MSTDPAPSRPAGSRRERGSRRRLRAFAVSFAAIAAALAVVGAIAGAASVMLGPRVTEVQVDPQAAISASGSRLIVTTSQSLSEVRADQVTITPATPFDLDTSGRSVGVRFTVPLDADTDYTVTIADVEGVAGGPTSTITESFTTPPSEVYLLQRGATDGDTIFRTDLTGEGAIGVFTHPHIEDFRATGSHLVVVVEEDGAQQLRVMDLDGANVQQMPLPGEGSVSSLQIADRGERVGYLFTAADLSSGGGYESALFTASLDDPLTAPVPVAVAGADDRIGQWSFVPDTDSVLLLTFDGVLLLTATDGSSPASLGSALAIDGISSGTAEAIIERIDGLVVLDLVTAEETPLVTATPDTGLVGTVLPLPRGGTVRMTYPIGANGLPTGETVVTAVTDEGQSTDILVAPSTDAVLQTCISPSGQYAAVLTAPDIAANPYDTYRLPLPRDIRTRILTVPRGGGSAQEVVALAGFAISWCQTSVSW